MRIYLDSRRIYVASSWRNEIQSELVIALRAFGYEVYDFKNPRDGDCGFHWSEIDPNWQTWTGHEYQAALNHPIAEAGYKSDIEALDWCDTCVLVQPCGRSAHLELGYAVGRGKATAVLIPPGVDIEPELMVKMCDYLAVNFDDLFGWLHSKTTRRIDEFPR